MQHKHTKAKQPKNKVLFKTLIDYFTIKVNMNTLKSVKKNVYYNKIGNQFSMFIHMRNFTGYFSSNTNS